MKRVITAEDLAEVLSGPSLLVEVTAPERFAAGHIPGARHVAPTDLVSGVKPATGRLPGKDSLAALLGRIGYRSEQTIVAYDDEGGGWAGRLLWTLDVIGHENWLYLDGGLTAWVADGRALESGPPPAPVAAPVAVEIHRDAIAEADDILERLGNPDTVIWDCRSAEEFRGEKQAAARAGHIPGAVNLDWLDLMDHSRNLRLKADLEALLAAHGITPDHEIITHCQTHHRSGLSYLVARCLGFPRIRAYHGSWSEWGNRDDTPVESGA